MGWKDKMEGVSMEDKSIWSGADGGPWKSSGAPPGK